MVDNVFNAGIACIVMNEKDNVVTLLKDVKKGEEISFSINEVERTLSVKEDVRFGHKLALKEILARETIYKYGEAIGIAAKTINVGEHVHVHNLLGVRGNGEMNMKGRE
ncbi:UxaA family hydrolase [Bacillus sp. JCM 19034]|uniref:UxaA family hydrolase n=1 Tax=Bacillus sp. JCM 19034 TaxID=1481928 RepID=UPI0007851DB7|nr:UxaA family hydrolase [Bacillus sp. JCM 19034]